METRQDAKAVTKSLFCNREPRESGKKAENLSRKRKYSVRVPEAEFSEDFSLALQEPVDIDLESSDEESECDVDLDHRGHDGVGDHELGPIEGFENFDKYAATMMGLPDDDSLMDLSSATTHSSLQITQALHTSQETTVEDTDDEVAPSLQYHDTHSTIPQWHLGDFRMSPTVGAATLALTDLKKLLYPHRNFKGHGHKPPSLGSLLQKRLMWMEFFLRAFVTGALWSAAALQTAQFVGKGTYVSRKVREWSKSYILDRENLPFAKYGGKWTRSWIDDEDLKEELLVHLQSLGKYISATAVIDYLARPDVQRRFKLTKTVSLATAQRWMENSWYELDLKTRKWSSVDVTQPEEGQEIGRQTVVWFHDESTFYANDRRKKCWVHTEEKATPQPKGKGSSLMVADFVSADYGWLRSHDGKESARVLFRAGKGRDGYFTNDEILRHAKKAMVILEKDYPEDDHVFVFDNATTHLKRADDALSARKMPKSCKDWGVNAPVRDAEGKQVHGADGKISMQKVCIANGVFNGAPQDFYFPEGHTEAGMFKGMAKILEERGFDVSNLKAQCKNLTVHMVQPPVAVAVFSTTSQISLMSSQPGETGEANLEHNVVKALDAVPLTSMRKFGHQINAVSFMDAYHKGLNGKQAAWAAK
ncbi:hypothetical protein DFH29DRAFT_882164 [Suillus ampliporus]|nr:hypothetical protein DFH29DRAFT_882164 [Suillus ampliporus]